MPDMQRGHPSIRLIIMRQCLFDTVVTHAPWPRHELALGLQPRADSHHCAFMGRLFVTMIEKGRCR